MKVYRDCYNGVPPFDSPATVTIFNNNGTVNRTLSVAITSSMTVPPNNPCPSASAGSACVEEAIYTFTVNLPSSAGGYYIAYQRCCRNGTILNLVNPGAVGTTYWEHIPGTNTGIVNSSPRFSYRPHIYVCADIPINFNHMATDPDGDVLVYSLCTPFNGLDQCCPIVQANVSSSCGTGLCPTTNSPPPYVSVPFSPPYSASYPMASNPALNVHPQTGWLNGNPTTLGQWVVGVCVSEYRNGVLIGTHHRDFQFNVVSCPVTAEIISQTTTNNGQGTGFCNGFTISYYNDSSNGVKYFWDFGDPSTTQDTSSAFNPTYTFTNPGVYTATLIVNPGIPCSDTTTEVFTVAPLLVPDYVTPASQCLNGNQFVFNGGGDFEGTGTFNWNFGPNATPTSASTATVSNVSFNGPGVYPVVFTVNENGCSASATHMVEVILNPMAAISNPPISGCEPLTVSFVNGTTGGSTMNYIWNFSDGTSSAAPSPVKTFSVAGVYSVSLTAISSMGCADVSTVTAVNSITVLPMPVSAFSFTSSTGMCFNNNSVDFSNSSTTYGAATYQWDFGPGSTPLTATSTNAANITYAAPGIHTVSLTTTEAGCAHTSTQQLELFANPFPAIGPFFTNGCTPFIMSFPNQSTAGNAMSYFWQFSDGSTSTDMEPVKTFSVEGVYTVSLTVSTSTGCVETNSVAAVNSITITQTPEALFNYVSATDVCFNNNSLNFTNASTFFGSVVHSWDFGMYGIPQNSVALNVSNVSFNSHGSHTVTLTEDKNGCIDTHTAVVELYQNPVANLGEFTAIGCDPLVINFNNQSTSASMLNYFWEFSDGTTSIDVNPVKVFTPPGVYSLSLTVMSNQNCIDTSRVISIDGIRVHPTPEVGFVVTPTLTTIFDPEINFLNNTVISSDDVATWYYDFGDGFGSTDINAFHIYQNWGDYHVSQTITNSVGCPNTAKLFVRILPEFRFWIPNAFSPGKKDGLNDIFKPTLIGAEEYTFLIFDRWGEQIYKTNNMEEGWDGRYKDANCTNDVYIWKCDFRNIVSKKHEYHIGHVTLLK